jgi:hypothetical protein
VKAKESAKSCEAFSKSDRRMATVEEMKEERNREIDAAEQRGRWEERERMFRSGGNSEGLSWMNGSLRCGTEITKSAVGEKERDFVKIDEGNDCGVSQRTKPGFGHDRVSM